jgi:uncharacterized protein (TIGR02646 family)
MIPLAKTEKPAVLVRNADAWTRELLEALANNGDAKGVRKNRYNNPEVKKALIDETRDKCAYCESKISHVTYGDIEHIAPKSVRPELTYEWDNLTLACDVCNTKKSNHEGLVDPYTDAIDQFFRFAGPMICAVPGRDKAGVTEAILKLNRVELMERRGESLNALRTQISDLKKTVDEDARKVFLRSLLNDVRDPSREYAGCASAFIEFWKKEGVLPADVA